MKFSKPGSLYGRKLVTLLSLTLQKQDRKHLTSGTMPMQ